LRSANPIMRPDLNLSRAWFSKTLFSLLLCLSLQACVTPSDKLNEFASEQGFLRSTIQVKGFELLAYQNWIQAPPKRAQRSEPFVLHVYLEGDVPVTTEHPGIRVVTTGFGHLPATLHRLWTVWLLQSGL